MPSSCFSYGIMVMCWAHQSHHRPTFRALLERLKVLRSRVDRQSFVFTEREEEEPEQGSDSELEEEELAMELDEAEREESARAATGEGQVHFGMADATERYVSAATMSRQGSRRAVSRRSLAITVSDGRNGSVSGTPTSEQPHCSIPKAVTDDERGKSSSPFFGKRKAGSTRRKSSGASAGASVAAGGMSKSRSSGSLRKQSTGNGVPSAGSLSDVEPDRVVIPSTGVVIEFGSASRLI